MANLFQKHKILFAILATVLLFGMTTIVVISLQNQMSRKYSTPDLIQLAFARGEINKEQRLLYLAYALGDSKKLPSKYISKAPWSGTMIGLELYETVKSKEEMCRLSPFAQNELQRVLKFEGISCDD
jgi:hypothetical protein